MVKTYVPKIALMQSEMEFIKSTVNNCLPDSKVYIFGSRVLGTAKRYSDVDIAIENSLKIEMETLMEIKDQISENSEYLIDIVDLNSISIEFKNIVLHTGIEI
jgi:uncharacterized protein